jgi:hypothetical protein
MTGDEYPAGPALRQVLAQAGGPELLDLLAEELTGADLTTLLLEVFRRRADRLTPAEVMRRYRTDRFVTPAPANTRTALAATTGIDIIEDPDRATGRGYYIDLCYKIYATIDGQRLEIADGGFVDWTQRLTGNRKERLLIGGFGLDRLATVLTPL